MSPARRSLLALLGTSAFFTWVGCAQIFGIQEGHGAPQSGDGSAEGAADGPAEGSAGDASDGSVDVTARDAGDGSIDGATADGSDAGDACPPLADASDFYVDHAAAAGACDTFPTIAAALQAARTSTAKLRTIHLAAGTYSVATGESFPIELRGGISVIGAGQGESKVTGTGSVDVSPPKNAYGSLTLATALTGTFLVGDSDAKTSVSNLSIEAPPGSNAGLEAIVCDRGNAASSPPAPNTIIDSVAIVGFEASVRVTWSSSAGVLSGCNALVRSSILRDGAFGVVADGLFGGAGSPTQVVSVHVGDSAGGGNTLLNFDYSNNPIALGGSGLAIADAVTAAVVRGNKFAAEPGRTADFGIWALQQTYDAIGLDIEDNFFGPLANGGIALDGNVVVTRLLNNTIQGVTMENLPQYGWLGVGLGIGVWGVDGMPFVETARNNSFVGNDIGVIFRSGSTSLPTDPSEQSDFGTASDPGGNSFHCNSTPGPSWSPGGDLFVDVRLMQPPSVLLPFVGNVWDHAAPTTVIAGPDNAFPNGTDVYEYGDDGGADGAAQPFEARIDVSGASTVAYPCPSGRVPGP
jgi:hypothetical protein